MTSKNLSINYQKLERTQRLWAFWLLLYLAAMSVLSFTFEMFSLSDYHAVTSDLIGVPDVRSFCFTVFSAVFCGIHGFLYLHSRKKADFFLSLPLSRKQLFFASYWNGILFYLIPFAAYKLISFVIADVSGQILSRNTALFSSVLLPASFFFGVSVTLSYGYSRNASVREIGSQSSGDSASFLLWHLCGDFSSRTLLPDVFPDLLPFGTVTDFQR